MDIKAGSDRLRWYLIHGSAGLTNGLLIAAAIFWFGSLSPAGYVFTIVLVTLFHVAIISLAPLLDGNQLAQGFAGAFSGIGMGALWWAVLQPESWIWVPLAVGACLGPLSFYEYNEMSRESRASK